MIFSGCVINTLYVKDVFPQQAHHEDEENYIRMEIGTVIMGVNILVTVKTDGSLGHLSF